MEKAAGAKHSDNSSARNIRSANLKLIDLLSEIFELSVDERDGRDRNLLFLLFAARSRELVTGPAGNCHGGSFLFLLYPVHDRAEHDRCRVRADPDGDL